MRTITIGLPAILLLCVITNATSAASTAADILAATGAMGGVAVHLGCGDGRLTAALGADERFTVHGLSTDPAEVAAARQHVRAKGLYGRVSIELSRGATLPYVDNLVNLVVVDEAGSISPAEIARVLAPGGVAYVKAGDAWTKTVKPWPDEIDQWTHFLHGSGNNAVAADTVVGPPRQLQWLAGPLWLRSHETPSGIQSPVSADGRLFYFFDEGLVGITDQRLPDRWSLVCRDAFNGRLLWKRPLGAWGWRQWNRGRWQDKDWTRLRAGRTDVPPENQRRIVAVGDRVYATLSYRAPMSILDATIGDIVATVEETLGTAEILVGDGVAVCYTREVPEELAKRRGLDATTGAALTAVDGRSGKVLWRKPVGTIRPLCLAIDAGRVVFLSGKDLTALDLKDGSPLWKVEPKLTSVRTLVAVDEALLLHGGTRVAAHNAADGKFLWEQTGPRVGMGEVDDLFVVDGLVWRGMVCVTDDGKPTGKSANAMVVGWDLRTGEEKKRIRVDNLRSPEHHHRCYRNKATSRYLISSFEGAEFLDFLSDGHSPNNNWLRGACRYGMTPCNGMLYAPPDQCFCQPGSKLLGYSAIRAESKTPIQQTPDARRLERGPAYDIPLSAPDASRTASTDWPTLRHDAARSGATPAAVPAEVAVDWTVELGGRLTAPVAAAGKLFVAQSDAHTLHALDAATGNRAWKFTVGGRIDSPPTVHQGLVLCGAKDGYVYCLRADDGRLVWRFLAAPADRRCGGFDQIESVWPVHGSVLVVDGVAYFSAGRSTYLDGGIRVWGLEPATGKIVHKGLLEGPHRELGGQRDLAFFIAGANSDVLVSEGGFLYMRQKKMTPTLEEVDVPVLSSKGAQDVGLHVFSTAGLLDDSGYNRTFWMYSKRWPGFQLGNQAPKAGQLLAVGPERTYAVRQFYRRNTHSPMFFPGREGYLVFADDNANEPQIVGEPGARKPVRWLPQSDFFRGRGDEVRKLQSEAFGLDKMIGYTRAEPPKWGTWIPVRVNAMVKTADTLFVAGEPDKFDPADPYASFESREGAKLVALSTADGKRRAELDLPTPPVFDGLIATKGRLFVSLDDGSVVSLVGQ